VALIYFAHSYRERDARVVDYFGRLMRSEGLVPSLDPPSDTVNSAKLQRHLNSSDGMVAVLTRRESGTSPHILYELALAIKARFPLLVFVEDTLPNDVVSDRVLQQRFSHRSFLREAPVHRHALRTFKDYVGATSAGWYQRVRGRRTCLVLDSDLVPPVLREATLEWIGKADYEVEIIEDSGPIPPWRPYDGINSASVAVTFVDGSARSSYLTGFAAGVSVPTITLTTDDSYPLRPNVPAEYQGRFVVDVDHLTEVLRAEFDLFEQDFLELADQEAVDRYASFLIELSGEYDANTRQHAIREVVMGDKYEVSGQAGAVGREAHAHDMSFQQIWANRASEIDLPRLAEELETLRKQLRQQATTREHDAAVAEIGAAAEEAERGDGPGALQRLKAAGQWALNAATSIGTTVAAAAIRAAMGM
jgi:hypothetical protein